MGSTYDTHDRLLERIADLKLCPNDDEVRAKAIAIIKEADAINDYEIPHMTADQVMSAIASRAGFADVVRARQEMDTTFYYA